MSVGEGTVRSDDEDVADEPTVRVGTYTWTEFFAEVDPTGTPLPEPIEDAEGAAALGWQSRVDPAAILGFDPQTIDEQLERAHRGARSLDAATYDTFDPEGTPVTVGEWTWHHVVRDVVDPDWNELCLPEDFEQAELLGFPEAELEARLGAGGNAAAVLSNVVAQRTVRVHPDLDEDAFFADEDGNQTVVSRYDLEKAVPVDRKVHFREEERYWVNKPYAFVIIFQSEKENETKYYLIEPHLSPIERDLLSFLTSKLRTSIKYSEEVTVEGGPDDRRAVIERETLTLLERYDLYDDPTAGGFKEWFLAAIGRDLNTPEPETVHLKGAAVRPEPALLEEDRGTLTPYQVEKLLYRLHRDFVGYERIDGIKHDINVEDISCDGYESPVFVYHSEYEQIITNVFHGTEKLDDFVVKLAQRSGKGISKRQPQVDATLPDGSRAQLTLGREVSDHGTNYTIRQFKDVPFTPIDLINWRTFSLEEMAFLWLCIENHKSLIFAGGTASGKTTSLNAVSLFIPSNSKIVSIEDTREVELPQRNWIASVTRPSFSDDATGDVDEFDLLEAALRQRPEYIVMGEIRGEEGRTLFQVMSTGHTTYTTFHADSVGEVLKRFTTAPINVSKTMFTALDLVSIQTSTRVQGRKVRRNKSLTEINHYDTDRDEINVQDIYQWQAETDEYLRLGDSNTLDEILFDRGWDRARLVDELQKREVVLAYLIQHGLNEYGQVAATLQAFINDPETTFGLIANGTLEDSLEDLRSMESVLIDVDPDKEALVPRPEPDAGIRELTAEILDGAAEDLFPEYRTSEPDDIADALPAPGELEPVEDPFHDATGPASEWDVDASETWEASGSDAAADGA